MKQEIVLILRVQMGTRTLGLFQDVGYRSQNFKAFPLKIFKELRGLCFKLKEAYTNNKSIHKSIKDTEIIFLKVNQIQIPKMKR